LPSQSTKAPQKAEGRNINIGEQGWKKTQRRRGGKASHTRLTPTTAIPYNLHLHEVAVEREEQR
jgi:hypothetical protein